MQQGAGKVQPQLHAFGELVDALVGGIEQVDPAEHLAGVAGRPVVERCEQAQVFERGEAQVDGGQLKADPDPLVELPPDPGDRLAEQLDGAVEFRFQSHQDALGGRFAGAGRAEQAIDLAGPDIEAEVIERWVRGARIGEAQVLHADHDNPGRNHSLCGILVPDGAGRKRGRAQASAAFAPILFGFRGFAGGRLCQNGAVVRRGAGPQPPNLRKIVGGEPVMVGKG